MRNYLYPRKSYAVSVIIPLFNAEKYIGECLDSLLAQTFQDFEVIVVDDCSTDKSSKVVENYVPKFNGRLTVTATERNSGSGALPRNKGLSVSRGEYIFFLDADDMLTKTALEELYGLVKKYDSDVVYCEKHYVSDSDGKNIRIESRQKGNFVDKATVETDDLEKRIQGISEDKYLPESWNKFVRRNLIMTNEIFFPAVKINEGDIWTFGLIFYAKKILRVPNVIYIRRISEDLMARLRKTSQRTINFWLTPALLGLKYLDNLMSKHKFFQTNLSCRYAVLKKFVNDKFVLSFNAAEKLSEEVIYSTIKEGFAEKLGEYDVLISALCATLCNEKIAVIRKSVARMDFKFVPKTRAGNFQILSMSDDKADVKEPSWLNKGGVGYVIQSCAESMKLVVKATADGQIRLNLRGSDVRTAEDKSKRIPFWIDYTKLIVNGKIIFDKPKPVWHDKPYDYTLDVKADEEIKIHVEWLPHKEVVTEVAPPQTKPKPVVGKLSAQQRTARLDFKFSTTAGGDFQILSLSDKQAEIKKPPFLQKDGVGYQIQSQSGKMSIVAKVTAYGQLSLSLRGIWFPDPKDRSKLLPYRIDYTKLTVNDRVIFNKVTPAWHDEPYIYKLGVNAGNEIKIEVEWLPHKSST